MKIDLTGRCALITGGTRGLGLASALALGRCGADVYMTHRWGSADESEIASAFKAQGSRPPHIVEADVAVAEDTTLLMESIALNHDAVDVFVSGVCVAPKGDGLHSFKARALAQAQKYSIWPTLEYYEAIIHRFGRGPRCLIANSSDGGDHHYPGYDYVGAVKAGLEELCLGLASQPEGITTRIFVLRSRQAQTQSYSDIFGARTEAIIKHFERFSVSPEEVADAVVVLATGLLDGLHGQILSLDKGAAFLDNLITAGPMLDTAQRNADV